MAEWCHHKYFMHKRAISTADITTESYDKHAKVSKEDPGRGVTERYRKSLNLVKDSVIKKAIAYENKVYPNLDVLKVLDIAGGSLKDMHKYGTHAGAVKIHCIDRSLDQLLEGRKRLRSEQSKGKLKNIDAKIIHKDAKDIFQKDVLENVYNMFTKTGVVDLLKDAFNIVSCQLAMHYFLNNDNDVKQFGKFLNLISNNNTRILLSVPNHELEPIQTDLFTVTEKTTNHGEYDTVKFKMKGLLDNIFHIERVLPLDSLSKLLGLSVVRKQTFLEIFKPLTTLIKIDTKNTKV